ncbi:hypothetical protein Avbf_10460 [Armadillidium vulgare]|nr:hypothetical protein Avbf_10460 [Armadillidium vulgare]
MGRRGSAPLLKHDDMRSTLRANYDRPMHELPKRRGSAPSHHLAAQLGPDCLNKGAYGTSSVLSLLSGGGGVGGASCGHGGGGGNNAGGFVGKNKNNNGNDGYGDGTGGLTFCSGGINYGVGRRVLGGGPLRGGGEASLPQTASGGKRRGGGGPVRGPLKVLNRGNSFSVLEPYLRRTGSDILSLLSQERVLQQSNQLLTQTQKGSFPGERNNMGCLRLSQRRGSAPWDGQRTDLQAFWANQSSKHSETSSKRQYSDGAGSLQLEFMPSDIQGNYCGGGGVTPGSLEFRRGSVGFELMAGLWRLRMEPQQGSSLCSNESVRISSSGDGTPGTPGVPSGLNPSLFQGPPLMPGPITRRGSLPTDIIIGGDFDRWGGLDDS